MDAIDAIAIAAGLAWAAVTAYGQLRAKTSDLTPDEPEALGYEAAWCGERRDE
ncbi:hypothetical protein [Caldimonas sp. KR1-144]|uniref:hypothetical protein n=1 Tax=Caldimonas sp. KR1-144 TaxID=3400911 RepID=UPI003BFC2A41